MKKTFSPILAIAFVASLLASPVLYAASVEDEHEAAQPASVVLGVQGESTRPESSQAVSAPQVPQGMVTLEELTREALQRNPAIRSVARRVQALRARVPQAKSLPDPVVSAGWMGNATPFSVQRGDPSSYRSVNAMQEIPFPGKLRLRGQIATSDADAAWWDFEETRRQVVAEVKAAYYDYFYYQKALDITRKDKDLLEKLTQIAEVRYKVGKGVQQDVLRAQVELSRLLQQLTVLEQQEETSRVKLNTLLFRDPETALPPAAPFEQAQFAYTLDEIYQMARQNDPGVEREKRTIERNEYAVNLARKDYDPDLRIGYMYQQRPLMPDMHGLTFGINIPIFYKTKQRQGVVEATEELASARRSLDDRLTTVNFEVKQQYLAAKASRDLARLYSQAIVPQSSLALESAMASYETGKVDFLSLLDSFINVLNFETNYYRELSNFQIALARLEPLVGRELTK